MKGIGNDIVEIDRVAHAHQEHGDAFLDRLFTKEEQAFCHTCANPYPRFAGRFAAKEAVAKALGTGFGAELSFTDIEILPDKLGKPVVHLCAVLKERHPDLTIHISISHARRYATAIAIAL